MMSVGIPLHTPFPHSTLRQRCIQQTRQATVRSVTQVVSCCTATPVERIFAAAAVAIVIGPAEPHLGTPKPVEHPPDIEIFFFNNPMPQNSNPSPGNAPDDGCGTSSGRFGDGVNSTQQMNGRSSSRKNTRHST